MSWTTIFFVLGSGGVAVAVRVAMVTSSAAGYLVALLLFLLSALCGHIWSLRPAANLSLVGVLYSYMERLLGQVIGRVFLWRFNHQCRDVEKTQEKTLMKILNTGKHTVYGRDNNMADIKTVEDFRSRVKLSDYCNYKPYVDRCLTGEKNMLFPENVDFYGATSGTTSGKSKIYPVNRKAHFRRYFSTALVSLPAIVDRLPKILGVRYQAWFWVPSGDVDVGNGFKIGSISAIVMEYTPRNTTPREGYTVKDEHTGQYIHMVFALREREVGVLMAMTSSVLFMILSLVENNWQKLVLDIRRGRLDSGLDITDDVRTALNKQLTPDPTRADELEAIFRSGFKEMVPKIWPDLGGIIALCTGTFSLETRLAQDRYVGYDIPIFCNWHMATEGVYGVLLFDDDVYKEGTREVRDDYVIISNLNFYEFVPMDQVHEETPTPVLAQEVEIDVMYELVVTTPRGLYRFRTGDVVRVVGFRGTTPKYQILQRVVDVLNVHLERTPEVVFGAVIQDVVNGWPQFSGKVIHFAGCENVYVEEVTGERSAKLYYVVFMEMDSSRPLPPFATESMDEAMCRQAETYLEFREQGTISALKLIQIHPGTFDKLKNMAASTNPLLYRLQYKHPRVVRNEARIRLLLDNQI